MAEPAPDNRPMSEQAPKHPGLWLALGHQHIGFSTAPGTAKILGELMFDEGRGIIATMRFGRGGLFRNGGAAMDGWGATRGCRGR